MKDKKVHIGAPRLNHTQMKNNPNYVNLVESYSRYKRDGRGAKPLVFLTCMVRILDGSSEYDPGVLRKIGNSIYLNNI